MDSVESKVRKRLGIAGAGRFELDCRAAAAEHLPMGNLPNSLDRPVGRDRDLLGIHDLLQNARLVTVTGPPGVGKTRVALETAGQLKGNFADGAWFTDFSEVPNPGEVGATVAKALSVPVPPGSSANQALTGVPRNLRLLLVFDNCEHVVHEVAQLAESMVKSYPGISIITTSREPLNVMGEKVWRLSSLATPPVGEANPKVLRQTESVQLFVERAKAVRHDFALSKSNAATVAEICRQLDGMPLALELAALRMASLSPAEILEGLADSFAFLSQAARTTPARHQSLKAAFDWSFQLLSVPEQIFLARTSIFPGGFTAEAAREVCTGKKVRQLDVPGILESLQAKSLIDSDISGPRARYRTLETIRQYASEKLKALGEVAGVQTALINWGVALAENSEPGIQSKDQVEWTVRLTDESRSLDCALEFATSKGKLEPAMRMASALTPYWCSTGRLGDGRDWLNRLTAQGSRVGGAVRAKAWRAVATIASRQGDLDPAMAAAEQSLELYRELGDSPGSARALCMMGSLSRFQHPRRALSLGEESLALASHGDDDRLAAEALAVCGSAHIMLGEIKRGEQRFQDSLELSKTLGDPTAISSPLRGLAWAALAQGDIAQAGRLAQESLDLVRTGDPGAAAECLVFVGDVATIQGRFAAAHAALDEALEVATRIGAKLTAARACAGLGRLCQAEGRADEAAGFFDKSIIAARRAGAWYILLRSLLGRSETCGEDLDEARKHLEQALDVGRKVVDKQGLARVLQQLGVIARQQGNDERAGSLHHEALAMAQDAGDSRGLKVSLVALAGLAVMQGRPSAAARLFGAAHTFGGATMAGPPPGLGRSPKKNLLARAEQGLAPGNCHCCRNDDVDTARNQLSDEEFRVAWAEGAAMSMDEAVAYATRGRGGRGERAITGWASLTKVEREVIDLIKEGLTNAEIAERMFVSPRTVESHLYHIYPKLGIKTRKDLARRADLLEAD